MDDDKASAPNDELLVFDADNLGCISYWNQLKNPRNIYLDRFIVPLRVNLQPAWPVFRHFRAPRRITYVHRSRELAQPHSWHLKTSITSVWILMTTVKMRRGMKRWCRWSARRMKSMWHSRWMRWSWSCGSTAGPTFCHRVELLGRSRAPRQLTYSIVHSYSSMPHLFIPISCICFRLIPRILTHLNFHSSSIPPRSTYS